MASGNRVKFLLEESKHILFLLIVTFILYTKSYSLVLAVIPIGSFDNPSISSFIFLILFHLIKNFSYFFGK